MRCEIDKHKHDEYSVYTWDIALRESAVMMRVSMQSYKIEQKSGKMEERKKKKNEKKNPVKKKNLVKKKKKKKGQETG
jgi:hypothetical protein